MTPDLLRKFGIDYFFGLSGALDQVVSATGRTYAQLGQLIPSGWLYQEKLNYSRLFQLLRRPLIDEAGAAKVRISPAEVKAANKEMEQELAYKFPSFSATLKHTLFARLLLPALGNISARAASTRRPPTTPPSPAHSSDTGSRTENFRRSSTHLFPNSSRNFPTTFLPANHTNIAAPMTACSFCTRWAGTRRMTAELLVNAFTIKTRATGSGITRRSEHRSRSPPRLRRFRVTGEG
jgi:hypothetical protein